MFYSIWGPNIVWFWWNFSSKYAINNVQRFKGISAGSTLCRLCLNVFLFSVLRKIQCYYEGHFLRIAGLESIFQIKILRVWNNSWLGNGQKSYHFLWWSCGMITYVLSYCTVILTNIQFQLRPFCNASGPLSKFKSSHQRANRRYSKAIANNLEPRQF